MKNRKTYIEPGFGKWRESEQGDTLRASHGGGEVLIVDVLPFDTTQITHKANYSHPTWGVLPSTRKRSAPSGGSDKGD